MRHLPRYLSVRCRQKAVAYLLMVHVPGSRILDEFPNLSAYVARAEARRLTRALSAAQLAVFTGDVAAG
jgi:hypothetical protein